MAINMGLHNKDAFSWGLLSIFFDFPCYLQTIPYNDFSCSILMTNLDVLAGIDVFEPSINKAFITVFKFYPGMTIGQVIPGSLWVEARTF